MKHVELNYMYVKNALLLKMSKTQLLLKLNLNENIKKY